ncbi:MAG TPA: Holliday junction branch migration protein RuvA [Steroidobacteraceae bacterium]
MIGRLRGRLVRKSPPALIVDVGGVGYELEAPMSTFYRLPELGSEVELHTHLVVREDAHLLYGFATEEERRLFRDLLRVTGIGPKIGLALLSGIDVPTFLACVEAQDVDALVRIPGIGRKTAERLLVEMRDRIRALGELPSAAGRRDPAAGAQAEAHAALVALGYRPPEATRLLKSVEGEGAGTEELIRRALQAAAR